MRECSFAIVTLTTFLFVVSGCSRTAPTLSTSDSAPGSASGGGATAALAVPVKSDLKVDIFAARGFLDGSDYERYVLKGGALWRECGGVLQKDARATRSQAGATGKTKNAAVFREDPNLSAVENRVESLNQEQLDGLTAYARDILDISEKQRLSLPLPGSVFSLTQPGVFELGVSMGQKSTRVVTSVDAVADREARIVAAERAHRLFRALRSIGPVICKSRTFFGVGREGTGRE